MTPANGTAHSQKTHPFKQQPSPRPLAGLRPCGTPHHREITDSRSVSSLSAPLPSSKISMLSKHSTFRSTCYCADELSGFSPRLPELSMCAWVLTLWSWPT
jgi:hypothetical protein